MKFFLLPLLLGISQAANALDLADVAGTYGVDNTESQKYVEGELATLAKAGKPTADHDKLLKEMKANPAPDTVSFTIAPNIFIMKINGQEMNGVFSDVASGADQIDFTMTLQGEAQQIRIRKFKDGMILMINRGRQPEMTIVLKKKGEPPVPVAPGTLTKTLVGKWNLTGIEENKKITPPPAPAFLELSADQTYQGELGLGGVESGTWAVNEKEGTLTLKSKDGPLEGAVTVAGDALTLAIEASIYHYQRVAGK